LLFFWGDFTRQTRAFMAGHELQEKITVESLQERMENRFAWLNYTDQHNGRRVGESNFLEEVLADDNLEEGESVKEDSEQLSESSASDISAQDWRYVSVGAGGDSPDIRHRNRTNRTDVRHSFDKSSPQSKFVEK
jgi:hypothetical protein